MKRAAATIMFIVAAMMMTAGPAQALPLPPLPPIPGVPTVPGVDCTADVTIGSPVGGPANGIDPGPENPRSDFPDATIYEAYGYGGLSWPSLNPECELGPDALHDPGRSASGTVANILLGGLALGVAVVAAVLRFAFSPSSLDVFDPVMTLAAEALGDNVFRALFWLTLALTGVMILFYSSRARFTQSARSAGWVMFAGLIGLVATLWPLTVAPVVDDALTGTLAAINTNMAGGSSTGLTAADGAAANLHRAVLYETWCAGMVGRAGGKTADKFCPALFASSTLSREELAEIAKDPSRAEALAEQKAEAFTAVAEDLKEADPAAYEYLAGEHNTDRIWYAVLGLFAFVCAGPFMFMSGVLLLYGLIVVRVAIMLAPAAAVIGGFPKTRKYLTGLFDYVMGALVTALMFGALAAVFIAMVGGFLDPSTGMPAPMASLLLGITTIVAWRFSKPLRRVKALSKVKRKHVTSERSDDSDPAAKDEAGKPKKPSGSGGGIFTPNASPASYADTTPAEARPSVIRSTLRGAAQGAAASLAMGLVTGGTATAAGTAAGAARGAGGAAVQRGMANRGSMSTSETTPVAIPAHRVGLPPGAPAEQKPRVYTPGEATPNRSVRMVAPTTTDTGERVYPIYTPEPKGANL